MQFASLTSIWFALTLPMIVIMYLFKRKYIDTEISSHFLWNRVLKDIEANRPWQKLRNNILLLIQLLVAGLFVFALMQPFVWSKDMQSSHVLIVIDRSASMLSYHSEAEADPTTRLEKLKQEVINFVENRSSNQPVTMIAMGDQAEILLSQETENRVIEQALLDIEVNYGRTAYKESMSLAAALTRNEQGAEIRVFTDGQWVDNLQGLFYHVPVRAQKIADQEVENVSIMQFGVKKEESSVSHVSAVATLKNWGTQTMDMDLSLYNANELHTVQKEVLEPGEQKTFFFNQLPISDYYHLVVDTSDYLKTDNSSYAFLAKDQSKQALLLSEGNLFLEKALSLNDVSILKTQMNEQGRMVLPDSDFDFVVIDAVDSQMLETKEWQDLLAAKPVWYISYDLQNNVLTEPSSNYTLSKHPVTEYIHFQDTHIAGAKVYDRMTWGEAVITSGDIPLVFAGTVQGHPRILFTFDLHHSDLPLRSEFPVLVGNVVNWLNSGKSKSLGHAMAGEQLEISLSPKTSHAEWKLLAQEGETFSANTVNGLGHNEQIVPAEPGLYEFNERDQQGEMIQSRLLHVMMDPRESNLAYQPALEFPLVEQNLQTSEQTAVESARAADGFSPYDFIPWIIVILIALILVEWGVYQRGSSL